MKPDEYPPFSVPTYMNDGMEQFNKFIICHPLSAQTSMMMMMSSGIHYKNEVMNNKYAYVRLPIITSSTNKQYLYLFMYTIYFITKEFHHRKQLIKFYFFIY